jgi:catechol 2,3-dioxygenase-like lactoylglutathione lyase family enzyme
MAANWQAAPVLGVRNVRDAAEYWRDVLGFHLDAQTGVFTPSPDDPGGVYAIVSRDGVVVHFQIRRGEWKSNAHGPLERDVYVYVKDLDAVHEDLARRGANLRHGPRVAPYGIREIEIEDPNGYVVTFGEVK